MKIRISQGTAVALGLSKTRCPDLPTTGYLLEGQGCMAKCAFCPQAGTSDDSRLSRVIWPEYDLTQLAAALGKGEHGLKRLCLQATRHRGAETNLEERIRELADSNLPVCLSAGVDNLTQVEKWLAAGADKVSIALDGATPAIFKEVKGGDFHRTLTLLEEAAGKYPGRMATHLIVGLGETEEEMCRLIARLTVQSITVALFAFTPVAGTPLGSKLPPEMGSWRRLQVTNALLSREPALLQGFRFSPQGRILAFGLGLDLLGEVGKEAFRTSGCPDCNRPYYNERPGSELYNYPRPLTDAELAQAVARLEVEE